MMNAQQDNHAMENHVRAHVETIKIVWPMKNVFVVFAEQYVITMLPAVKAKFVKIVFAK
jgi:hypothetical protein